MHYPSDVDTLYMSVIANRQDLISTQKHVAITTAYRESGIWGKSCLHFRIPKKKKRY